MQMILYDHTDVFVVEQFDEKQEIGVFEFDTEHVCHNERHNVGWVAFLQRRQLIVLEVRNDGFVELELLRTQQIVRLVFNNIEFL